MIGVVDRDFVRIGKSKIHGTGVFAKRAIHRGARIIDYQGLRVRKEILLEHQALGLTSLRYVFNLNDTEAIDGEQEGNAARFVNHSCEPNCVMYVFDETPYLYSLRDIRRGEELTFDYRLRPAFKKRITQKDKLAHPCNCGAEHCRGTMIYTRSRKPSKILSE
jgi:uncharacterized protein